MSKFFNYLKYTFFFLILMFGITFLLSVLSLVGMKSNTITKIGVILNAIIFFITSMKAIHTIQDKGYILGLKLGCINIFILIIINLIFFQSSITINRFIYYFILLISSILGTSFGKNFHIKLKKQR